MQRDTRASKIRPGTKELSFDDVAAGKPTKTKVTITANMEGGVIKRDNTLVDQNGNPVGSDNLTERFAKVMEDKKAQEEAYNTYNKLVKVIDPRFSKDIFLINGLVLVRMFNQPLRQGAILLSNPYINVPTKSGHGTESIPNPYPYSNIGVIVNFDKKIDLREGSYVQVNPNVITPVPVPGTRSVDVPYHYRHFNIPVDSGTDNYGYILIQYRDIVALVSPEACERFINS